MIEKFSKLSKIKSIKGTMGRAENEIWTAETRQIDK